MTITRRDKYTTIRGQKNKATTIEAAKEKVDEACSILRNTELFSETTVYQPKDSSLYIKDAPAIIVERPEGKKLVIAPDVKCKFRSGDTIWVEVKDKPQRVYYPDTGCDVHQYVGFWSINKYCQEPVLLMFIDPSLNEMKLKDIPNRKRGGFIRRWTRFAPKGKPAFYGNWLSNLALYDERSRYPMCDLERSRNITMNIVYMSIDRMISFGNISTLVKLLKEHREARLLPDFKVFYKPLRKVIQYPEKLCDIKALM